MRSEKRQDSRYKVLGRVHCKEFSPLSGSLVDVSLHGCKIFYNLPVTVRLEDEYEVSLQISDSEDDSITLICCPAWVNEDSGSTVMGMSVLRSLDSEKFAKYISRLDKNSGDEKKSQNQIVDSQCQFL
ncbi:MAG: PilZ domain-containing protein [Treponema sp.]|nr:PilZ domain-containing protein [Treponema sp.]